MIKINPYLIFNGKTEEAFNFYKSIFGGEFRPFQRFKDLPEKDREMANFDKKEAEKIVNIGLSVGDSGLMANDTMESMPAKVGENIFLSLEVDGKEVAEKFFTRLSEGGKIHMALADTFWGAYCGMIKDKFGVGWVVSYAYPKHKS